MLMYLRRRRRRKSAINGTNGLNSSTRFASPPSPSLHCTIAFNSYDPQDGGALDLFNVDGNGHPDGVVASITPAWNSIAFFEVRACALLRCWLVGWLVTISVVFVLHAHASSSSSSSHTCDVSTRRPPPSVLTTNQSCHFAHSPPPLQVSPLSYHQVAEVLDDTKGPRLSISGWFHGAMPTGPAYVRPPHPVPPRPRYVHPAAAEDDEVDEEHDAAEKEEEEQLAVHATPLPSSSSSSSASPSASSSTTASSPSSSLAHWINPTYLKASIIPQMRASYTRDASLSLESFLREDRYAELYTAMGHQRWTHVGPAVLRSYKQLQGDGGEVGTGFETDCTGAPVQRPSPSSSSSSSAATGQSVVTRYNSVLPDSVRLFQSFITSPAFYHYIAAITGSDLDGVSSEFRAFAHGDYTMLSDTTYKASLKQQKAEERGLAPKPTAASASSSAAAPAGDDAGAASIDVTLCCVQSPEEWPDEAGGYVTYMTADDELLSIPPKANNLSIVCKEPGVMSFVKFVSHRADETRYDVAMSFKTRGDGDGE